MNIPRPTRATPEMALRAALIIANSMAKHGLIEDEDVEDSALDIAKYGQSRMDGYELAKTLECHYWDCNLEMAEELDSFSSLLDREIFAAEKLWAETNDITAPLPVGTKVSLLKTGETGEITGIYEYGAAKFAVKIDGDARAEGPTSSRRIVNFEDVKAV